MDGRTGTGVASPLVVLLLAAAAGAQATPGHVLTHQKISNSEGLLGATVPSSATLGVSTARLGDLDGDGRVEIAVGASSQFTNRETEAVWILSLEPDGTVHAAVEIADGRAGFSSGAGQTESFGISVASAGDLDGDGRPELVVGEYESDDGGFERGAAWILFLGPDGLVRGQQQISSTAGGFTGALDNGDHFGRSVAGLGDLDGDGVPDIAVSALNDDDGGPEFGAVWILFLRPDGTVDRHQKISKLHGGFDATLFPLAAFGEGVAAIGDLDDDGVVDLAVGAAGMPDGGSQAGAVFVLFLRPDGTVDRHRKISATAGGLRATLDTGDLFGATVTAPGDLDGDGVEDLVVGAVGDDDGGFNRGASWVLFLERDGSVRSHVKISATSGSFKGSLDDGDWFGAAGAVGDLNGDGVGDLGIGALLDDDGGTDCGAIWMLFLEGADCAELDGGAWSHLGASLPGARGAPCLFGRGSLETDHPAAIGLRWAPPGARALLAVGVAAAHVPLLGGVLVPDVSPPGAIVSLLTDASGAVDLVATTPPGLPPGLRIYLQFWVTDPTAPAGFSASNAVVGEVP